MKHEIEINERILLRLKKETETLRKQEVEARRLLTLGYKKFLSADEVLSKRNKKRITTNSIDENGNINKTVQRLWDAKDGWKERNKELTKQRDDAHTAIALKEKEIKEQEELLNNLLHEQQIQLQKTDGMVDKVFTLNDSVVAALEHMDRILATEVFPQLHEKSTQKTIENSDSTKRLMIMTNSINIMDVTKVEEATALIDAFFVRINPNKETESQQDDTVTMLSELLKELLVVKIKVKAGPNLSKFLALDLNEEKFSELKQAQRLLASATNYVRSGKYIRLYVRDHKDATWQPVRQS